MNSLYDLTLKGHFQSLKEEMNRNEHEAHHSRLLFLLEKAVGVIEEVYEKDFHLLHMDNALDYKEIVEGLNDFGVKYSGNKKSLEMDALIFWRAQNPKVNTPEKLPMKKASGKLSKNEASENRKTG